MTSNHPKSCPSFEALSMAFSEMPSEALSDHLAGCESCRRVWTELGAIKSAAQALPWDEASAEQVAGSKAQLLLAARYVAPHPGPWRAIAAASTLLAIAASALLVLRGPDSSEGHRSDPAAPAPALALAAAAVEAEAAIAPPASAPRKAKLSAPADTKVEHYARQDLAEDQSEELVRVTDGIVKVDLDPLADAERFRLMTLDAEIESRAAVFEVQVEEQHLHAVWVASGEVEVRPSGGLPRILRSGDRWTAPSKARAERGAPAPAIETPIQEPEPPPPSGEALFTAGFDAFERGEHRAADQHFAELLSNAPDHPLAEDAAYWRALALAKLDDPEADSALAAFVASHARSERSDRLALVLGLRQAARGALSEALENLRRAETSASAEIRERAQNALSSLGTN